MLDRYLFLRLLKGQLALTLVLAVVIWLVQALDLFDKTLSAGASPLVTLGISLLILPRVITFTLGPALLITVLSQMVRLLQDYEYFALTAAGLSPLRILRPIALLAVLTMLVQSALAFYISPIAMKHLKIQTESAATQLALGDLQAGTFKDVAKNLTIYTSGRDAQGLWQDIVIYDTSSPKQPMLYTAQKGEIGGPPEQRYFVLQDGTQKITNEKGQLSFVHFSRYLVPLSPANTAVKTRHYWNRNQMMIHQLLDPAAHGVTHAPRIARMQARGLELISNLAAPFIFTLISFAVVTAGGLNRHGYGRRILIAVALAIVFQIGVITMASLAVERDQAGLVFLWPLGFFATLCAVIMGQINPASMSRWNPLRRKRDAA
ncbi:MAG: LptF/LptG family permease [Alphaproteobacteria bacterium]|nr:LptF/LptG family permease [Alphaproteobacteria bacterium]